MKPTIDIYQLHGTWRARITYGGTTQDTGSHVSRSVAERVGVQVAERVAPGVEFELFCNRPMAST